MIISNDFFLWLFVGDDFVSFVLCTSVSSDSVSSYVLEDSQYLSINISINDG